MSEVWPLWSCELSKEKAESFTVGKIYDLSCRGDYIEKFQQRPDIKFTEAKYKYALKILEPVIQDHQSASYKVTAYKPGQYSGIEFTITDGFTGFRVNNLNWKVTSVIEPGVQQEPYGPVGPFKLSMPWWFWGTLVFILVFIGVVVFRKIRKYQARKSLLEELEAHTTALSPFNQFSKDMRMILRKFEGHRGGGHTENYFQELDEAFRLYLIRELKVPAIDWRAKDIMGEIHHRHKKVYLEAGDEIRKMLLELEKAKKVMDKIVPVDCEQLATMSRRVVDQINRLQRKRSV